MSIATENVKVNAILVHFYMNILLKNTGNGFGIFFKFHFFSNL